MWTWIALVSLITVSVYLVITWLLARHTRKQLGDWDNDIYQW